MAAPKKTIDTNPELAFLDADLLDLRRQLKATDLYGRASIAGCVDFVAGEQAGDPRPDKASQARYRKMLRHLLDQRTSPTPARRRRLQVVDDQPALAKTAGRRRSGGAGAAAMVDDASGVWLSW